MVERKNGHSDSWNHILDDTTFWDHFYDKQEKPFRVVTALIELTDQYMVKTEWGVVVRPEGLTAILAYISKARKVVPYDLEVIRDIIGQALKPSSGITVETLDLNAVPLQHIDYEKLVTVVHEANLGKSKKTNKRFREE